MIERLTELERGGEDLEREGSSEKSESEESKESAKRSTGAEKGVEG